MVTETSMEAHSQLNDKRVGAQQLLIIKTLRKIQPATNRMIALEACLNINVVTPRCNELKELGFIVISHKDKCQLQPYRKAQYLKLAPIWCNVCQNLLEKNNLEYGICGTCQIKMDKHIEGGEIDE